MVQTRPLAVHSFLVALRSDAQGALVAPARVQLLPAGLFAAKDGRPGSMEGVTAQAWRLTATDAAAVIAALGQNELVIDYEHQTLNTSSNGQPAPAAGWFRGLEFVEGQGLFTTDARWTARAAQHIGAEEYRYISAVFTFDPETGAVEQLLHIALTNNPALDGLQPVTAAALTALSARLPFSTTPQEKPMKKLLAALGLAHDVSEDSALTALTTLQGRADLAGSQVSAKDAEIAALKANQFDPAKHIPMVEHKKVADQLAALTAGAEKTEHEGLMTAALADARILPVNEAYWRAQPLAALKEFLKDAKPLAALAGTQTGGKPPADDKKTAALTAEEQAVARAFGQSAEQFAKAKQSA